MAHRKDSSIRFTKQTLPVKVCPVCGRPFTWRKKWARTWETVTVCSERCRRRRRSQGMVAP